MWFVNVNNKITLFYTWNFQDLLVIQLLLLTAEIYKNFLLKGIFKKLHLSNPKRFIHITNCDKLSAYRYNYDPYCISCSTHFSFYYSLTCSSNLFVFLFYWIKIFSESVAIDYKVWWSFVIFTIYRLSSLKTTFPS